MSSEASTPSHNDVMRAVTAVHMANSAKVVEEVMQFLSAYRTFSIRERPGVAAGENVGIVLDGLIPSQFHGQRFHTPVLIALPHDYPTSACTIRVVATGNFVLVNNDYIESRTGVITLPQTGPLLAYVKQIMLKFCDRHPLRAVSAAHFSKAFEEARGHADRFTRGKLLYTGENGVISGVLPITYKGNAYNIPIKMHFSATYPVNPPIVCVMPTPEMIVSPGPCVTNSGQVVNIDKLNRWTTDTSISALLGEVQKAFEANPPVRAKPAGYVAPTTDQVHVQEVVARPAPTAAAQPAMPAHPQQQRQALQSTSESSSRQYSETSIDGQSLCIICMEGKADHACVPCGHVSLCAACSKDKRLKSKCPVCRTEVQMVMRIYQEI